MASTFETSLLCRTSAVNNKVRPIWSDSSFWSDVIISTPDTPPFPLIEYGLVTDAGDEIVDQSDNTIVVAS